MVRFAEEEPGSFLPLGQESSNDRFLAVMQESADVFWVLTPAGEMQDICSNWHTFTGQEERACLGRGWLDALHPADQPQFEETVFQAATTGRTIEQECHLRRRDNAYRLVHLRAIPVRTTGGTLREVVVCGTDITRQELVGQMSDIQMQFAIEVAHIGMWDQDLVTGQLLWTAQEKALFGWVSDAPVNYERFLAAVHPADRERVEQANRRNLAANQEHQKDFRVIWPDGSVHWLSDRARDSVDARNQLVHTVGATVDITELKQVEERLYEAYERITAILESITNAFVHVDTQWRLTYVNRWGETYLGNKREALLGQRFWDVFPVFRGTSFEQQALEAMETRQEGHFETTHLWKQRWFEIHLYPALDGLSVYFQDITERKQAEGALRESEVRFRRLVDSNIIGIMISDPDGNIFEANDAFLALVGYTRDDLEARRLNWKALTPPDQQMQIAQTVEEELKTGAFTPFEKEYLTKDGKRVPVLVGGTLFQQDSSGKKEIVFVVDLSARKENERQKDLFLSMTSHELKTPLAALKGTFQLLQRRLKRLDTRFEHVSPEVRAFFDDLAERLAISTRQVDVQTRLINDLLDVSRITANTLQLDMQRCDLVHLVRETVADLRVTVPERSLLLALPERAPVEVLADAGRLGQVVTNYVTNALRYSSPDQPIHIGLSIQEQNARVWVRDHGPGLTETAQKELWRRFHQIKGVTPQGGSGKGLGLGLYICQMLIAHHQGEVGVESILGEGSTFWFTLPLLT